MTKKKNKFFTFCFSLLPGAGEMYMGFMKLGVSIMGLFFIIWGLSESFHLPFLFALQPILWFYSFFNVHNINALPDEEFFALEDHFLFSESGIWSKQISWLPKHQKILSYTLIFFGIAVLWNVGTNTLQLILSRFFSKELSSLILQIINSAPQLVIGLALLVIGYQLIKDKKEFLKEEKSKITGPV